MMIVMVMVMLMFMLVKMMMMMIIIIDIMQDNHIIHNRTKLTIIMKHHAPTNELGTTHNYTIINTTEPPTQTHTHTHTSKQVHNHTRQTKSSVARVARYRIMYPQLSSSISLPLSPPHFPEPCLHPIHLSWHTQASLPNSTLRHRYHPSSQALVESGDLGTNNGDKHWYNRGILVPRLLTSIGTIGESWYQDWSQACMCTIKK